MTEYDIPTGPLSTAVFLTVSDNGEKVWFTEYAANKIAYLDTTVPFPFEMQVTVNQSIDHNNQTSGNQNNNSVITPLVLKSQEDRILDVTLKAEITSNDSKNDNTLDSIPLSSPSDSPSLLSLNEVELSVIGMTDSGLVPGFTYSANPQRITMSNDGSNTAQMQTNKTYNSKIKLVLTW